MVNPAEEFGPESDGAAASPDGMSMPADGAAYGGGATAAPKIRYIGNAEGEFKEPRLLSAGHHQPDEDPRVPDAPGELAVAGSDRPVQHVSQPP